MNNNGEMTGEEIATIIHWGTAGMLVFVFAVIVLMFVLTRKPKQKGEKNT